MGEVALHFLDLIKLFSRIIAIFFTVGVIARWQMLFLSISFKTLLFVTALTAIS